MEQFHTKNKSFHMVYLREKSTTKSAAVILLLRL